MTAAMRGAMSAVFKRCVVITEPYLQRIPISQVLILESIRTNVIPAQTGQSNVVAESPEADNTFRPSIAYMMSA